VLVFTKLPLERMSMATVIDHYCDRKMMGFRHALDRFTIGAVILEPEKLSRAILSLRLGSGDIDRNSGNTTGLSCRRDKHSPCPCTSCGIIWARWAGVMGVPMKWEIARIFVVGTGGSGFCAEAAPSGVIGFYMAVAPYSSFGLHQRD
jgi:hypothetical protein